MKNSVITAAIIGSLICGLLIVIAVSCACKLVALRHMEQYRSRVNNPACAAPFPNGQFRFPLSSPGDLDASLFRLDHSVFLRDPPPSYATTMGGYQDITGANASYMEQYRRYRRQRRCRRMMRRQHRANQTILPMASHVTTQASPADGSQACPSSPSTVANPASAPVPEESLCRESAGETSKRKDSHSTCHPSPDPCPLTPSGASGASVLPQSYPPPSLSDNHQIELETIPVLTHFDCDSQPLIR